MAKPIAVLTADVHYSLATLELADAAMRQAMAKANNLDVPLIIAGDLHDTKANMRAECVNAMLTTFIRTPSDTYLMVGNHDKVNEKSPLGENSLNFLAHAVSIVDEPWHCLHLGVYLIPYQYDVEVLRSYLKTLPKNSTLIMHQGIEGSNSGDYIQDRSAINHEDVKDFRVISGHYHTRQDIKTGPPRKGAVGLFSYIGNPYTLNYGEAKDPEKGFQILMDDGTLEFVPTNLRKHVVIEINEYSSRIGIQAAHINPGTLVKIKISGTREELASITKARIAEQLGLKDDFKLELIPKQTETQLLETKNLSHVETLDQLIDSLTNTSEEQKGRLKELWKAISN